LWLKASSRGTSFINEETGSDNWSELKHSLGVQLDKKKKKKGFLNPHWLMCHPAFNRFIIFLLLSCMLGFQAVAGMLSGQ
jgi:hypothetical protein